MLSYVHNRPGKACHLNQVSGCGYYVQQLTGIMIIFWSRISFFICITGELYPRLLSYTVLFLEKVFTTCLFDAMEAFLFSYVILLFLEEIIVTCFSVVGDSFLFLLN